MISATNVARTLGSIGLVTVAACHTLPAASRAPNEIMAIVALTADSAAVPGSGMFNSIADSWIAIDTISFRPTFLTRPLRAPAAGNRFAILTSFEGARYHPEVVRGMSESGEVAAAAAGATASLLQGSSSRGLLLDLQDLTGDDRQILADVSRVFADSARARGVKLIGMIIPASDSIGYPAGVLAGIADLLVVKLFPEHGAGTPPGPIVSLPWFSRRLGDRAGQAGVGRIVAGIPVDGMLWTRDSARQVTYASALRLAESAGTSFVRDPASLNLHASSTRDGWEIWLVDRELVERLVAEARRFGVTRFAFFGIEGADPKLMDFMRQQ